MVVVVVVVSFFVNLGCFWVCEFSFENVRVGVVNTIYHESCHFYLPHRLEYLQVMFKI